MRLWILWERCLLITTGWGWKFLLSTWSPLTPWHGGLINTGWWWMSWVSTRVPLMSCQWRSVWVPCYSLVKVEFWAPHLPFSSMGRGFPGGTSGKEPACQCWRQRDAGSIPRLGRSIGGGHGNPIPFSCLENPMDEEPGGLWSIGVHRVEYDWWVLAPTYCFQNRMVIVQNVSLLLGFLLSRFLFFFKLGWPRSYLWHGGSLLPCAGSSLWHVQSSSLIRDQTLALCLGSSLNHWTTREVRLLVLWLETAGFCWDFFGLCQLEFLSWSFFIFICLSEAKRKAKEPASVLFLGSQGLWPICSLLSIFQNVLTFVLYIISGLICSYLYNYIYIFIHNVHGFYNCSWWQK